MSNPDLNSNPEIQRELKIEHDKKLFQAADAIIGKYGNPLNQELLAVVREKFKTNPEEVSVAYTAWQAAEHSEIDKLPEMADQELARIALMAYESILAYEIVDLNEATERLYQAIDTIFNMIGENSPYAGDKRFTDLYRELGELYDSI